MSAIIVSEERVSESAYAITTSYPIIIKSLYTCLATSKGLCTSRLMLKDYVIMAEKMEEVTIFVYRFNYCGGPTQNNGQCSDSVVSYSDSKGGVLRNFVRINSFSVTPPKESELLRLELPYSCQK